MRSAGFTLIELIMTMVVVGILAVFAVGRLDFASAFDQRATRDKLAAGIQFARKAAVAQRRHVCLCVGTRVGNACNASERLSLTLDSRAPETAGATFCDGSSEVALPLPAPDSACGGATNAVCAPSGITLGPHSTVLSFDALGSPSNGQVFAVTDSSGSVNVTLEAETGLVR